MSPDKVGISDRGVFVFRGSGGWREKATARKSGVPSRLRVNKPPHSTGRAFRYKIRDDE
jgi:hypothetical protein